MTSVSDVGDPEYARSALSRPRLSGAKVVASLGPLEEFLEGRVPRSELSVPTRPCERSVQAPL